MKENDMQNEAIESEQRVIKFGSEPNETSREVAVEVNHEE